METNETYKYFAFISYKSSDDKWAKWLQHKLEHYHLPSKIREKRKDLPAKIRPVFEFKSEMAGGYLEPTINKALSESKWLIVVCSPDTPQSQWVSKEVRYFIDRGRADFIIPFIVAGEAFSKDPNLECFPMPLRELPKAHRGISINELGENAAAVKVVAQMFGLGFEDLWRRFEREQRRKRNWIIAASITAFLIMAGVAFYMYVQRQQTLKANWKMMENQSRFVAEKASGLVDECKSDLAQRLLLEVLPNNLTTPNRPYSIEAEQALRKATSNESVTLCGHNGDVLHVAFSPFGRNLVASASEDSLIMIWNTSDGALKNTLKGHSSYVNHVVFSPDGNMLASSSCDNTVKLWDVKSGRELLSIDGHSDCVSCAAFNMAGNKLATSSWDGFIKVWDVHTGRLLDSLSIGSSCQTVAFCANDEKVVFSLNEGVYVWDIFSGHILTLVDKPLKANSICFSPDRKHMVVAAFCKWRDGLSAIKIWNVNDFSEISSKNTNNEPVKAVSFTSDEGQLLYVQDNDLLLWDYLNDEEMTISHKFSFGQRVFMEPNGKTIATFSDEYSVLLWHTVFHNEPKIKWEGHNDRINSLGCSLDGRKIASTTFDGEIKVWDVSCDDIHCIFDEQHDGVFATCFSSNGEKLITVSHNRTIAIWSINNRTSPIKITTQGDIHCPAVFNPNSEIVAFASDNELYLFDVANEMIIDTLNGHTDWIKAIAFSSDGEQLVSSSYDHKIDIWDVRSGSLIRKVECPFIGDMVSFVLSTDANYLITDSWMYSQESSEKFENLIRIWDVKSGMLINTLKGHKYMVYSHAFSPDNNLVVTTSLDHTIKVWDIKSGQSLLSMDLNPYTNLIRAVFNVDGRYIVSSSNNIIMIWDFPPLQDLIDRTRERFKDRPLTPEERRQYYLE